MPYSLEPIPDKTKEEPGEFFLFRYGPEHSDYKSYDPYMFTEVVHILNGEAEVKGVTSKPSMEVLDALRNACVGLGAKHGYWLRAKKDRLKRVEFLKGGE